MAESYRALCTDFYVNFKLSLKMDLPRDRQTVLDLYDRVRRQFPAMNQFKRFRDELALESGSGGLLPPGAGPEDQPPGAPRDSAGHRWLAIRNTNIRAGVVNPDALSDAYSQHEFVLEVAPFFLSISPLDVDYVELMYGFDLLAGGNHDAVVYDALLASSPFGGVMDLPRAVPIDCQPIFTVAMPGGKGLEGGTGEIEVDFEIKTRSKGGPAQGEGEPISVCLALRKFGPVMETAELKPILRGLARQGEQLLDSRVVPKLVTPIREAITSGNS